MKPKILSGLIFLIVCSIAATACSKQTKVANSDLEKNRRLWQERKIVNYNFEIMQEFSNSMPSLIQVRNGQVASKQPVGEKGVMDTIEKYDNFETIEKTFDSIQGFYDKGYRVEVIYNKEFGYPEKILFDHQKTTDSVIIIRFSKFEIIKAN